MKVGILGSGDVAKSLAGGFIKHGHQVMLGTREAGKLKDFVAQHQGAHVGSSPTPRSSATSSRSRSKAMRRSMCSRPRARPTSPANR
jgi:predicted dinucleotide-binding enzyme